jgi:hypothetical protein
MKPSSVAVLCAAAESPHTVLEFCESQLPHLPGPLPQAARSTRSLLGRDAFAFPHQPEEEQRLAEQAKTFPVKKLPYRGERDKLKFDRRTIAPRRRGFIRELRDGNLSFCRLSKWVPY